MTRSAAFSLLLLFSTSSLWAEHGSTVSRTNGNTLNDLVREVAILSPSWERQLRQLSSIQEQLYLFEREMRGEGLAQPLAEAFSIHYSAIVSAMVDDRISEDYGRDLLSVHRQLLARTQEWSRKRVRDEAFSGEVINNLYFFLTELKENSLPLAQVPSSLRSPVVNGYQVWLGELIAWGSASGRLSPGALGRLQRQLEELERFEFYYKRDGILNAVERELLHERFLTATRAVNDILVR